MSAAPIAAAAAATAALLRFLAYKAI